MMGATELSVATTERPVNVAPLGGADRALRASGPCEPSENGKMPYQKCHPNSTCSLHAQTMAFESARVLPRRCHTSPTQGPDIEQMHAGWHFGRNARPALENVAATSASHAARCRLFVAKAHFARRAAACFRDDSADVRTRLRETALLCRGRLIRAALRFARYGFRSDHLW